jgi:hypothetical protein
MTRKILVLAAAVLVLAGSGRVLAHHSFTATYDSSQQMQLEGTVKEFVWRNPHSFMRIDVTDKDGTTKTWTLEWGSISQLQKTEMSRTTLKPGDVVVVAGEPARDTSSARMLIQKVTRPKDGWSWNGRVE